MASGTNGDCEDGNEGEETGGTASRGAPALKPPLDWTKLSPPQREILVKLLSPKADGSFYFDVISVRAGRPSRRSRHFKTEGGYSVLLVEEPPGSGLVTAYIDSVEVARDIQSSSVDAAMDAAEAIVSKIIESWATKMLSP